MLSPRGVLKKRCSAQSVFASGNDRKWKRSNVLYLIRKDDGERLVLIRPLFYPAPAVWILVLKEPCGRSLEIPKNDANKARKDIAVEFLNLIGLGRPKEGLRFFAPGCKTHNPYTPGGIDALIDAMIAVQKEGAKGILRWSRAIFKLIIRQVLADGDLVAVHTQLSSSRPSEGGLRQVHLFRFSADKIVEYWDISQPVPENAANAAGAFSKAT